ncbi:DNA end-binding protein Ku [Variovorax boronicumulans]|uniref:Non-homologous end joining protein Ku n=1 Tax=Variovorax boronicumulans TaxID=436515 RepID=A0AAW8D7P0_9BURK|nr:Ku protein [Variovorax boronicumulans]MDP9896549.1 DNA end-binding protein Ku [Variovorax boronicumulans]MDQ0056668.1 DNA end-binding protein Ku [Variovorax boronicumulans]
MPVSKKAPAPRVLWKGAISFGLVHIPVALYSATTDHGIDFDWLDKRSMDPVGYKRINKKTGKEITRENIVKGVEYEDGEYVVLSDKEIAAAYPKTTQTIEIETFVPANGIPFVYLERPYYVAPINKGAKVYALLRETLQRSERVGVARVVIQTKQHLAVLVPVGPGLVLNLLRWGADIRPWNDLPMPSEDAKKAGLTDRELKMAQQLVEDMSGEWDPMEFKDEFKDEILRLIERKVKAGQTETVTQPDPEEGQSTEGKGAKIIDLTELLQRSLRSKGGKAKAVANDEDEDEEADAPAPRAKPAARKRKPAAKAASKAASKTATRHRRAA